MELFWVIKLRPLHKIGRLFSPSKSNMSHKTRQEKLTIFLSRSHCIYENLAFEQYLFKNHNGDALLLWSNNPTVVIGRHQNPWLEVNVRYCEENGINIARRDSGGGAVYHDKGNLNISILTSQLRHNRKRNLQLIAEYINKDLPLETLVMPNCRDDLVIGSGTKISGTAARISHGRAYHHFTLLINICTKTMRESLHSRLKDKIHSNATRSVPAKLVGFLAQKTLSGIKSDELVERVKACVISALGEGYEQSSTTHWKGPTVRISTTDADDDNYPGLMSELRRLKSEEWIYGKTPKFYFNIYAANKDGFYEVLVDEGRIKESVCREFPIGEQFSRAILKTNYV